MKRKQHTLDTIARTRRGVVSTKEKKTEKVMQMNFFEGRKMKKIPCPLQ
jgi:hypothetical protein